MNKKTLYLLLLFSSSISIKAQGYFSFYQLKDLVPQTHNLSATYIPNNSFSVGLPFLNDGIHAQGDFKIKDLLVENSKTGNLSIDLDNLLLNSKDFNNINIDFTSHLFYFGLKTKKGEGLSLFANTRFVAGIKFSKSFIDLLANGNGASVGETISLKEALNLTAYHEIGIGYARKFLDDKLTAGVRLKYLNGFIHSSTLKDVAISLFTEPKSLNWDITAKNATLNTSGINNGEYQIWTKNSGIAIDFGASYDLSDKISFDFSINDIGQINWKENVKNYNIDDGDGVFKGVGLKDLDDVQEAIKDSLKVIFKTSETKKSFKTKLSVKSYLSASYNITLNDRFAIVAFNNHIFQNFNPAYAISYNRSFKITTFGVVTSFGGNINKVNIGANVVANLGSVQLYLATDNLLSFAKKIEELHGGDIRFGINLMFGRKKRNNVETEKLKLKIENKQENKSQEKNLNYDNPKNIL